MLTGVAKEWAVGFAVLADGFNTACCSARSTRENQVGRGYEPRVRILAERPTGTAADHERGEPALTSSTTPKPYPTRATVSFNNRRGAPLPNDSTAW